MNKEEFLRTLGAALSGEVPQHIIQENLRYYDNYISGEIAKGRTEEEIMNELGGPRIVARTIIDAAEAGGEAIGENGQGNGGYDSFSGQQAYGSGGSYGYDGETREEEQPYRQFEENNIPHGFHVYNLNKWYWKLIGIVILMMVIFVFMTIIGGIASLLLSPVGLILIIILLLWRNQR